MDDSENGRDARHVAKRRGEAVKTGDPVEAASREFTARGAWRTIAPFLLGIFAFIPGKSAGEVVKLRDGREVICKIVREDESRLWVRANSVLLVIERSQLVAIEAGTSPSALVAQLQEAVTEVRRLVSTGRRAEAQRRIEAEQRRLDQELGAMNRPTQDLLDWKRRLREIHRETLGNDPAQRQAQELYEKALEKIDRIDHAGAFDLLRQAERLAPGRLDIRFRLAQTADILNRPADSMPAYAAILESDYAPYYGDIARTYLSHLLRHGRRALLVHKPQEALPYYESILLLQEDAADEPVPADEFGRRQMRRREQTRTEVMLQIFEYAKKRGLIHLALAAVEHALREDPENKRLSKDYEIWKFLSILKRLVEQGLKEDALRLKETTPAWILESEDVATYIAQIEGESIVEMQANLALREAERLLAAGEYRAAEAVARRLIEEFPNFPPIDRAREIIRQCRIEISILEAIAQSEEMIRRFEIQSALARVGETLGLEGIEAAQGYPRLTELARRLERERAAYQIWQRAEAAFRRDDLAGGKALLEDLGANYGDTEAGRGASEWLAENGERIARRELVLARMPHGLASIVLDAPSRPVAQTAEPAAARIQTLGLLDSFLDSDRPSGGFDLLHGLEVALPVLLVLLLLLLLVRKLAWPGGARFALRLEDYFKARRFREDEWGAAEEIVPIEYDWEVEGSVLTNIHPSFEPGLGKARTDPAGPVEGALGEARAGDLPAGLAEGGGARTPPDEPGRPDAANPQC